MPPIDWPANLCPANVLVRPPRKTQGLTTSLSQFTQRIPSIRPPFGLTIEFGALFGDKVLAYRALLASLEGRANTVRVPLFDFWFRASDAEMGAGFVPHDDGSPFSDGSLYATGDIEGVTASGVQGQRTLTVDFGAYGQLLQGGMYFGLRDHPYIAQTVAWAGAVATIHCSPSLRTAYTAEPLRTRPTMIAGLIEDDGGEHMLRRGRWTQPTLDFEERFDQPLLPA